MTKKYSLHKFSLCVLFVLATISAKAPIYHTGLLSLLLCGAISLGLIFLFVVLLNLGQKNKTVFYITVFCVTLAALLGAVTTFLDFFAFLKTVLLPQSSSTLLFTALFLLVLFFLKIPTTALLKYSLFTAVICTFIITLCFINGIKIFDFNTLNSALTPDFNFDAALSFLPIVVLPFFVKCETGSTKPVFLGAGVGVAGVFFCSLQSILILSTDNDITFPYLKAVGVISSGSLFTRLDGLVYFLFFVTTIIKITVCAKVILKIVVQRDFNVKKQL